MKWQANTLASRENVLGFALGLSLAAVLFIVSRSGKGANDLPGGDKDATQLKVVSFNPPAFNFGTVLQQETVERMFKLVNPGTSTVQIIALRSTCNCTIIKDKLAGMSISPGGSLPIPVEFTSGSQEGPVSSTVEVLLEYKGERQYARARLHGVVNADFTFLPRMVDFGSLAAGDEKAMETIDFHAGALNDFVIKSAQSSRSEYEVSFVNSRSNSLRVSVGERQQLKVLFTPPNVNRSMVIAGTIDVQTSSERMPMIKIPVRASVRPNLEVSPEVVVFPNGIVTGESRFKISTLQPSKIVRVSIQTSAGLQELETAAMISDSSDDWVHTHVRRAANAALTDCERIDFELEVRTGIGRREARTVSVHVQRL